MELYHPQTGTPLEAVDDKEKAIKKWIPYLEQIWPEITNLPNNSKRKIAEDESSIYLLGPEHNGDSVIVEYINNNDKNGHRFICMCVPPHEKKHLAGMRYFKWLNDKRSIDI